MHAQPDPSSDVDRRLEQLAAQIIRRRVGGERIGDDELIAAHPELMPALRETLSRLRLLEGARDRAEAAARIDSAFEESFAPRVIVEGYDILREISRGGQAIVFLARDRQTGSHVAIKTLLDGSLADDNARARFEREARILASLDHPGIVPVLASGVSSARPGSHFLVMPYIDGESFDSQFSRPVDDNVQERREARLKLFVAVLRAVGAAHARGIVHRDLKPSNIRIDRDGNPHVLDFGLAQHSVSGSAALSRSITASGQFVGSFPWASPEQAGSGEPVSAASDVYSLGVLLYQLLTGGLFPYEVTGPLRDLLNNIILAKPSPPSRVSSDPNRVGIAAGSGRERSPSPPLSDSRLDAILLKSLAKKPADRYPNADAFADDLERYLAGAPVSARPRVTIWNRAPVRAVIAIAIISAGVGAAMKFLASPEPRRANGRPVVEPMQGVSFVWIPPGEFMMGSPPDESDRLPDETLHHVSIPRGFYMMSSEVLQATYESVMGANPSSFKSAYNPVECVSWNDAVEFCRRLSMRYGKRFRLPTEGEWEYACRAGTTTAWSFGNDPRLIARFANSYDRSSWDAEPRWRHGLMPQTDDSHPFTCWPWQLMGNAFGLDAMHGNVWEWTASDYLPYPSPDDRRGASPTTHPLDNPTLKVARGGSWYDGPASLRSANRNPLAPSFVNFNLGFRVVMEDHDPPSNSPSR